LLPSRPDWLHELKYDGYRLRLITKGGYDSSDRLPLVVEGGSKLELRLGLDLPQCVARRDHRR
jgi:ATP-dependent DNA ligase